MRDDQATRPAGTRICHVTKAGGFMKKWGGNLFFFGVGSIILSFLNMQFIILAWIDLWGPTVGWGIRIGLTVVGGALWLIGRQKQAPMPQPRPTPESTTGA